MPISLSDLLPILGGGLGGYLGGGGIGGAIGGGLAGAGVPIIRNPDGTWTYGGGATSGGGGYTPPTYANPAISPTMSAIASTLVNGGATHLGNMVYKKLDGSCVQVTSTGIINVSCPGGAFVDPGAPWGGGGGGGFGGGGAGGTFGPPSLPMPPSAQPTSGNCGVMPYGMGGISIVETPSYEAVARKRPGYVTVTLPWSVAGYACGAKVQMLKEVARKFGLYKSKPKPVLTQSDLKCLRKAERVEGKLKNLTTRHTDFKVVKKR